MPKAFLNQYTQQHFGALTNKQANHLFDITKAECRIKTHSKGRGIIPGLVLVAFNIENI